MGMSTATASTIPAAPIDADGEWVSVAAACARLGLTERTVRRRMADGRLRSRLTADRREVLLPPVAGPDMTEPDTSTPDAPPVVVRPQAIDDGRHALAAMIATADRHLAMVTTEQAAELRRTRRHARTAWSLTAAAGILLAVGAAWHVGEAGRLAGHVDAADAARGILAAELAAERARADRLTDRLATLVETERDASRQATAWHPPLTETH